MAQFVRVTIVGSPGTEMIIALADISRIIASGGGATTSVFLARGDILTVNKPYTDFVAILDAYGGIV